MPQTLFSTTFVYIPLFHSGQDWRWFTQTHKTSCDNFNVGRGERRQKGNGHKTDEVLPWADLISVVEAGAGRGSRWLLAHRPVPRATSGL